MIQSLIHLFKNFTGRKRTKNIRVANGARFVKDSSVVLQAVDIQLEEGAELILDPGVKLANVHIHIIRGHIKIGPHSILGGSSAQQPCQLYVENGSLHVMDHSVVHSDISIRFGGDCRIGRYTGIMQGTEIRCDEKLSIGDYVMISYECMIYDTNTHVQYAAGVRRAMTEKSFPLIGAEHEKPSTAAVSIGDDCWLGKRAVILKGVTVGKGSTVATNAVLTKSCPEAHLAFGNPAQYKPISAD